MRWGRRRTWACVDAGHNEDGMEVDGRTSAIGGGAGDDAKRCDGRGVR